MGKRGPARQPKELLESRGARVRKDRYPKNTMKAESGGKSATLSTPIEPLDHLTEGAKKVWKEVSSFLNENGMSYAIFNGTLEVYCVYLDQFQTLQEELKDKGLTETITTRDGVKEVARPEVKMMNDAAKEVRGIASHFGLTPSSISQVKVSKPSEGPKDTWGDIKAG